ncbi:antimicrobial response protein [Lithospermum erythrorhizon]|uniref:Antimicrobial response protein n=1 Tax=Lithospermum erythrorhizon TaxID=34254 RepID=A0AAV3RGI9_LITER
MAVQCGGLPLAIIMLGGILTNKTRLSDWEEVNQNLILNLRRGRGDEQYGVVYEVLALSYNDLPYHLKHCFLHMGIFPEDYRIPARKLIQLWAAEGFIPLGSHHPGEGEDTMMDVGECYLGELAKRYMVQVQVDDSTRRFKSCRLHDLMRDVCLSKGKEENFLKILPHEGKHDMRMLQPSASRNSSGARAVRRLSVIVSEDLESYFPPSEETTQRVRTALFFCSSKKNLQSTLFLMCTKFRLLRIMDLENSELGKKVPKVIGNLVVLRFMSFKNCEVEKLSSSVDTALRVQQSDLEEVVTKYLNGDSNRLIDTALRVKYNFNTERDLALLGQLVGCRHLRQLDLIESIRELPHFRHFSSSLTSLTLRNSSLMEDPMATLEKFPTLSTLALRVNAFAGKKMRCSPHGFPQLRTLHLEGLLKLKKCKIEEEALPRLLYLEIEGCEKLQMVPDGLRNVTSMKELVIANMPESFSRRLKVFNEREGEDLHKIQHIPSIIFRETRNDVKKLSARQKTGTWLHNIYFMIS